jgi:hypothetical protein
VNTYSHDNDNKSKTKNSAEAYIANGFGSSPSDFRSVLKEIIQHIAYLDDNWSGIISKSLIIVCT